MFRFSDQCFPALQSIQNILCHDIILDTHSHESNFEAIVEDDCIVPRNSSNSYSNHSNLSLSRILTENSSQYLNTSLDTDDFGEISMIQRADNSDHFSCFVDSIPFTLKALGIPVEHKETNLSCDNDAKSSPDFIKIRRSWMESPAICKEITCQPFSLGIHRDAVDKRWRIENSWSNWGQSSSQRGFKRPCIFEFEISECANTFTSESPRARSETNNYFKKIKEKTFGNSVGRGDNCSGSVGVPSQNR